MPSKAALEDEVAAPEGELATTRDHVEDAGAAKVPPGEDEHVAAVGDAGAGATSEARLAQLERELGEARQALAVAETRGHELDEKLRAIADVLSRRNHLWVCHHGSSTEVDNGAPTTQHHKVSAATFVIGRDLLSSNLRIDHWAVAPKHANVEFVDGQYWMIATGPENLIFYNGKRVARKPIFHNDAFWIGGHEVRFTYDDEALRRALEAMMEGGGRG